MLVLRRIRTYTLGLLYIYDSLNYNRKRNYSDENMLQLMCLD